MPLLDVFYIIPVGIVLEMSPVAVGIIAFLGNFIMVLVFAMFFRQISEWRKKRREKRGNQSLQKEKLEPDIFGRNMVSQRLLCFHPRYLEQI
ncbi:small multi-drug export protein [Bacillus sp. OVS6]|nr:small multi-drug export protein [Bacillus sp. OVS6]